MENRRTDNFFGEHMHVLRKKVHLTQQEVADELTELSGHHVSKDMVCNWERGKVEMSYVMLPYLCKILTCSLEDLLVTDTMMDEGYHLPASVALFSKREKQILHYILNTWDGDRWSLLELITLYCVLPREYRAEIIITIEEAFKDCLKNYPEEIDPALPPDFEMVHRAFRTLIRSRIEKIPKYDS